ncbi:MAG TPA: hypothetical protein VFF79_11910 [Conexibacter sp.]|jgi:hypothetical protein|nr:hypothetical protein [Conexibacter sp.]
MTAAVLAVTLATTGQAHAEVALLGPEEIVAHAARMTFTVGARSVVCDVTLSGTLAQEMTLRARSAAGSVTEAQVSGCSGGTVEAPLGIPWAITYSSVLGALPERATGMLLQVQGFTVRIRPTGATGCLFGGTLNLLVPLSEMATSAYYAGEKESK